MHMHAVNRILRWSNTDASQYEQHSQTQMPICLSPSSKITPFIYRILVTESQLTQLTYGERLCYREWLPQTEILL